MIRLLLEAWAIAAALQLVLWAVQQRTRNAAIVDVGWAASFALMIAWFASRATTPASAWGPSAAITVLWSVRLSAYLVSRGAITGDEEGRYADLRARWAPHAARRFFVFFQAQALLAAVLASAMVVPFLALPVRPAFVWLGAGLSLGGLAFETIADAQLARFKRTHRGAVCDTGLWRWSRHPNYFGEWLVWLGHAAIGLAFWPWGLIALVPQAIVLASIFGVTGIPPTEAQLLRSRGDAYRDYQRRVSKFIPLPPKPGGSDV